MSFDMTRFMTYSTWVNLKKNSVILSYKNRRNDADFFGSLTIFAKRMPALRPNL